MKNYIVRATRNFFDKEENINRECGEVFKCTKERYEFLENCNGAVELRGTIACCIAPSEEEKIEEKPKKTSKKKNK